jgi:hypothetical protein
VFSAGDDQYNVFTDCDVPDTVNDAHVDPAEIRDSRLADFTEFFLRQLRVMLKVEFGNTLALV